MTNRKTTSVGKVARQHKRETIQRVQSAGKARNAQITVL